MFTSVATRSASAYRKVSVETSVEQADPHHLVDMLFDGLLHAVGAAWPRCSAVTSRPNASTS